MKEVLIVGLGGFLGSALRYTAGLAPFLQSKMNIPTLLVNLIGSLLIGCLSAYFMRNSQSYIQLFLITGFCGGFTTYSTFSLQLLRYVEAGDHLTFLSYLTISLLGGILLCYLGLIIGIKLFS